MLINIYQSINDGPFPHFEEFMDLVVQTDAFSLQDHDRVLKAKTRNEQKLALLMIIMSDREKQNTYWNILNFYSKDHLARNGVGNFTLSNYTLYQF